MKPEAAEFLDPHQRVGEGRVAQEDVQRLQEQYGREEQYRRPFRKHLG